MGSLMDEAQTMLEIGSYHDNIFNLQGVTCLIEQDTILQVIIALQFGNFSFNSRPIKSSWTKTYLRKKEIKFPHHQSSASLAARPATWGPSRFWAPASNTARD